MAIDTQNPEDTPTRKMAKGLKRARSVTLPTLKIPFDASLFVRFESAIETKITEEKGDDGQLQTKEIRVAKVTAFSEETGAESGEFEMVCPVILDTELNENFPGDGYVGKILELIKEKVEGKRYNRFYIYECQQEGQQ